jgi:hypothetical protein
MGWRGRSWLKVTRPGWSNCTECMAQAEREEYVVFACFAFCVSLRSSLYGAVTASISLFNPRELTACVVRHPEAFLQSVGCQRSAPCAGAEATAKERGTYAAMHSCCHKLFFANEQNRNAQIRNVKIRERRGPALFEHMWSFVCTDSESECGVASTVMWKYKTLATRKMSRAVVTKTQ